MVEFYVEAARWLHNKGYVVDDENMELYLADSGYDGTELDSFVLYENGCLDDPREGITNSTYMDLMQKERAMKLFDELSSYYASG